MKELSIFVDESGDLGEYNYKAPYYIFSMVLHDQNYDMHKDLVILENSLTDMGWSKHCVHAGPIIRSEEEYKGCSLKDRQAILKRMMSFIRHLDIHFKSIVLEKKHVNDSIDNGQVELTRILSSVFNAFLENVEFRKVTPADYRLFQVAD